MGFRATGNPPIESRVVDKDDRVRTVVSKVTVGTGDEFPERGEVDEYLKDTHHRQSGEIFVELATGGRHPGATVPDELQIALPLVQSPNEVRSVQIATRFSGRKKDFHVAAILTKCS